jgi:hypothetical protein
MGFVERLNRKPPPECHLLPSPCAPLPRFALFLPLLPALALAVWVRATVLLLAQVLAHCHQPS